MKERGMNGFEVLDHTADWAIRVNGRDLTQLFVQAAVGMNWLLVGEETAVPHDVTRELALEADDVETLLVDWLSELAYWAEMEGLVFPEIMTATVQTTAETYHLQAALRGGKAPALRKHIKAVTYHGLAVEETAVGVTATIIFDV